MYEVGSAVSSLKFYHSSLGDMKKLTQVTGLKVADNCNSVSDYETFLFTRQPSQKLMIIEKSDDYE